MQRVLVTFALAVTLAVPAVVASQATPAAASSGPSCTGWHSIIDPPPTIRVGRKDGRVDTVDFRTYVYRVMVKEWGGLNYAGSLEAAAVAVKQYAWYYLLAGNWRKSYVNGNGQCYDVKDSTADQLYRDDVTITAKVKSAVDNTWGLTVRKSNRFFLTGYRSSSIYECGVDANGWKLFAKSVAACGKDGKTREEIQLIYYAPDVSFHWSSRVNNGVAAPVDARITAPTFEVLTGRTLNGNNTRVSWDANGVRPDGTHFQFQRIVSGAWTDVALPDPTQTSIELNLKRGTRQGFRVRLRDQAGNYGAWFSSGTFIPRLIQDKNTTGALQWSNNWTVLRSSSASGGTVRRTVKPGSTVSYTFTGSGVALVGTKGADFGVAKVYVDGVLEAQVDMSAAKDRWQRIFFSRQWGKSATRTVTIEVVAGKAGSKFHFDAALTLP